MAGTHVTSNWRSTSAVLVLVLFAVVTFYAAVTHTRVGLPLYLIGILATGLGFWARQDAAAVGGILGLNLVLMLDIAIRIGILP